MPMAERFEGVVKNICEAQGIQTDTKAAAAVRQVARETLQEHIRHSLSKHQAIFQQHLQARDTSSAWGVWSRAAVAGFAEAWPHLTKADPDNLTLAAKVDHKLT